MAERRAWAPARALYVGTVLLGSFLLFLVQPMVARMALPRLGGAPAVWNSAVLVYQALLLGGYAYAHGLSRVRPRVQAGIHLGLLMAAALWLPIGLADLHPPPDAQPALWVPWLLASSIGPLFLAVSAQAPLVQRWFADVGTGADPYPLYAASNLGSFGGLLAYPLLVEPRLTLAEQSRLWSAGYAVLALMVLACALLLPRVPRGAAPVAESPAPSRVTILRWLALAAVPSGLMLATTTFLTTDIVAVPLLWVLPLGLYLLSWTVAFARGRDLADMLTRIAPITVLLFGGIMIGAHSDRPWLNAGVALTLLFMASVALHTALFRTRPGPDRLTGFYLATSVGGVLGGVFAGLLAPVLFDWTYEYPLLILGVGALVPQSYLTARVRGVWTGASRPVAVAVVGAALMLMVATTLPDATGSDAAGHDYQGPAFVLLAAAGLFAVGARGPYLVLLTGALVLFGGHRALSLSMEPGARTRSYFGVYTIRDRPAANGMGARELDNGTTIHGLQLTGSPQRERMPTTYYAPGSGVGQAMAALPLLYGPHARVGVVGLGTGTLSCYAQAGQAWRFYEIDPAVVRIARDTGQFSFLARCLPRAVVRIGDARLSLGREPAGSLDLLALDAFSSDAVPLHLLTQEAFATYARVLSRRGLLLVHISNRFLDLEPAVAAAARRGGWTARLLSYRPSSLDAHASGSDWAALSRDPAAVEHLVRENPDWRPLRARPDLPAWTDDHASILPLVRWPR